MTGISQSAADFVAHHAAWGGFALGLVTFGESIAVVGAFLPATLLLVAAGGMIAAGVLPPAPVLAWALAGAILGDAASYWLGARFGSRALRHPLLARRRRLLARTRLLTRRYGAASLFVGRFAGPLRAFVPVMAGIGRMPPARFHLANAVSGVVWVAAFVAPGYAAARGVSMAPSLPVGPALGLMALGGLALGLTALARGARGRARAQTQARTTSLVGPCLAPAC